MAKQGGTHQDVARPTFTQKVVDGVTRTFYRVFTPRAYSKYRNPDREARRSAGWPSGRQWVRMRKAARRAA